MGRSNRRLHPTNPPATRDHIPTPPLNRQILIRSPIQQRHPINRTTIKLEVFQARDSKSSYDTREGRVAQQGQRGEYAVNGGRVDHQDYQY